MKLSETLTKRLEQLREVVGSSRDQSIDEMEGKLPEAEPINVRELKSDLNELNTELKRLAKMRESFVEMAEKMGAWEPNLKTSYDSITKMMEDVTDEKIKTAGKILEVRNKCGNRTKQAGQEIASRVNNGFREMLNGAIDKALVGVDALQKVENRTIEHLNKINIGIETKMATLMEDIHRINRSTMQFDYAKNTAVENALEKTASSLERIAERNSSIKQAFQNLGRAFAGKEQEMTPAEAVHCF